MAGDFDFEVTRELEMVNTLADKPPLSLVNIPGKTIAGRACYRFLSDYKGWVRVVGEELKLEGDTYREYMVMKLRRGQVPPPADCRPGALRRNGFHKRW